MSALHTRPVTVQISTKGSDILPEAPFDVIAEDYSDQNDHVNNPAGTEYAVTESGGSTKVQGFELDDPDFGLLDGGGAFRTQTFYVLDTTTFVVVRVINANACGTIYVSGEEMPPNIDSTECTFWDNDTNNTETVTYRRCDGIDRTVDIFAGDTICVIAGEQPSNLAAFRFGGNGCTVALSDDQGT